MHDIMIAFIPAFLGALTIGAIRIATRMRLAFYEDFMERRGESRRHSPNIGAIAHSSTSCYYPARPRYAGIYIPIARRTDQEDPDSSEAVQETPKLRRFIDIGKEE